MSKDSSVKYYQNNNEKLQKNHTKKLVKGNKFFLKNKKKQYGEER